MLSWGWKVTFLFPSKYISSKYISMYFTRFLAALFACNCAAYSLLSVGARGGRSTALKMTEKLLHASINTNDIQKTLEFYSSTFPSFAIDSSNEESVLIQSKETGLGLHATPIQDPLEHGNVDFYTLSIQSNVF